MKNYILLFVVLFFEAFQCLWGEDIQIVHYNHKKGNINEHVYGIRQDSNGLLWIYTYGGLYSFDGNEFVCNTDSMIAPVTGYKWKPSTPIEHHLMDLINSNDPTIPFKQVRCGLTDADGNLWVGNDNGLWMINFNTSPFHFVDWGEEVVCIFRQKNGNLWMSTRDRIVCLVDDRMRPYAYLSSDGEWKNERTQCGYFVMNIVDGENGDLWLSARNDGLLRLSPKNMNPDSGYNVTVYKDLDVTPLKNIYSTYYDSTNKLLWIASLKKGLLILDCNSMVGEPTNKSFCNPANNLPSRLRGFTPIDRNHLLVNSDNGLFLITASKLKDKIEGMEFMHTSNNPSSIADNSILCLYNDVKNGLIYAGTSGSGLSVIEQEKLLNGKNEFHTLNQERNFLPSNVIYTLNADSQGRIWGFCDNDLFCIVGDNNIASYQSLNSTPWPGMSIGNALRLEDGRMIKGTHSGVLIFNSDSLASKKSVYNIFTRVTVIDKSGDEQTMILQDTIRFSKRPTSIKVYASVLDFQRVSNVVYAYRVANIDSQWKYTSDVSYIELPKLPYGYSTLEIEATNGDGVWSGNKRSIIFYTPYNWNNIIAITVLCLLISCIVYISLYKYHGMRMKLSKVLKRNSVFDDIPTKEELTDNFKKVIREKIIENLGNSDFSIDGLAKEVGLSRSVLSTKIKENFDMTPIELINTIRIQAARELLLNSDMNISEIAYKTGFNDPKYFSRAYKKQTGKSPTQERQQV